MDKYLEEIKSYLYVLDSDTIEKEINNIKNYIEKALSDGKKFEDLNLASAKDQAIEILKSYNINSEIILKKGKNDLKGNLKIIFDILVLLIFISLVKIPFIGIRNIGESLLQNIDFPLAYDIWGITIEIVYIFVAILIFINVFPKWFRNLKPSNKVKKEKFLRNAVHVFCFCSI